MKLIQNISVPKEKITFVDKKELTPFGSFM